MTRDEPQMFILAKRIYRDYLAAKEVLKSVEPENFVEKWLDRNVEGVTPELNKQVWKFFLENLKNKRIK